MANWAIQTPLGELAWKDGSYSGASLALDILRILPPGEYGCVPTAKTAQQALRREDSFLDLVNRTWPEATFEQLNPDDPDPPGEIILH